MRTYFATAGTIAPEPDATGTYYQSGLHDSRPWYLLDGGATGQIVWRVDLGGWIVWPHLPSGYVEGDYWLLLGDTEYPAAGEYLPVGLTGSVVLGFVADDAPEVSPPIVGEHWPRRYRRNCSALARAVRASGAEPPPPPPPLVTPVAQFFCAGPHRQKRRDQNRLSRVAWVPGPDAWGPRRWYYDLRGLYRIFNAAGYRFYRSNAAPPAESDSPFATSASLPYTPTDTYADGRWYISLSYFNGVLDSGFLPLGPHGETYLRLDISDGVGTNAPPAGPLNWQLVQRAGGVVGITAAYMEIGATRADQWAIAYTTDGSTPAAGAPSLTPAISVGGLGVLDADLPAVATGTTVKVRLQTRRNDAAEGDPPAWIYSENSEVKSITIDTTGPSPPIAGERWAGPIAGKES